MSMLSNDKIFYDVDEKVFAIQGRDLNQYLKNISR